MKLIVEIGIWVLVVVFALLVGAFLSALYADAATTLGGLI